MYCKYDYVTPAQMSTLLLRQIVMDNGHTSHNMAMTPAMRISDRGAVLFTFEALLSLHSREALLIAVPSADPPV
jgi:hypothetical protein